MRTIPRPIHGLLDYLTGLFLLSSPYLLEFSDQLAATVMTTITGLGIILYSLLTDYEFGASRQIPFPVHRGFDVVIGLSLIVAPALLDLGGVATVFLVCMGVFECGVALLTLEGRGHFVAAQR